MLRLEDELAQMKAQAAQLEAELSYVQSEADRARRASAALSGGFRTSSEVRQAEAKADAARLEEEKGGEINRLEEELAQVKAQFDRMGVEQSALGSMRLLKDKEHAEDPPDSSATSQRHAEVATQNSELQLQAADELAQMETELATVHRTEAGLQSQLAELQSPQRSSGSGSRSQVDVTSELQVVAAGVDQAKSALEVLTTRMAEQQAQVAGDLQALSADLEVRTDI
jgi:hypothetical protein